MVWITALAIALALAALSRSAFSKSAANSEIMRARSEVEFLKHEYGHQVSYRKEEADAHRAIIQRMTQDYAQRERQLLAQIQNLMDRISRLKLTPGDDGEPKVSEDGDTPFLVDNHVPYSAALTTFLSGIETDEARTASEELVESYRAEGMDDDQILRRIAGSV